MVGILVDENLPPRLVSTCRSHELPARHIYDLDLDSSADATIWRAAHALEFAVATKDEDFVDFANLEKSGQVILFAVGNMRIQAVLDFAESRMSAIRSFLASDDRVLVLRP